MVRRSSERLEKNRKQRVTNTLKCAQQIIHYVCHRKKGNNIVRIQVSKVLSLWQPTVNVYGRETQIQF